MRLIDADKLEKNMTARAAMDKDKARSTWAKAISMIHDEPSAQSEIIRCGQCKYAEVADKEDAQDGYTCQFHRGSIWFSGSYCSWAERRNDEAN